MRQYGRAFEHAAPALRNDKEVVLTAVRQYGRALQWAAPALRNDKQVVLGPCVLGASLCVPGPKNPVRGTPQAFLGGELGKCGNCDFGVISPSSLFRSGLKSSAPQKQCCTAAVVCSEHVSIWGFCALRSSRGRPAVVPQSSRGRPAVCESIFCNL